jgi:hypothetical protein
MHEQPMTWRTFLGEVLHQAPQVKLQVVKELCVNATTLTRWITGESEPRPSNVRQLRRIMTTLLSEPERSSFFTLLEADFPETTYDHPDVPSRVPEDGNAQEISADFFLKILEALSATADRLRFWSMSNMILQQALGQLDPDHLGMLLTVVQCMPPRASTVRSLRERVGLGTRPWRSDFEQKTLFLGSESLAGFVVASGWYAVSQELKKDVSIPIHLVEYEESAAAAPFLRAGRVAGCLLVSSTQPHYFSAARLSLIQGYTHLLALAFEAEEFYELTHIELHPMPQSAQQQASFATLQKRQATILWDATTKNHPISHEEGRTLAFQQLEDVFLSLPAHTGS